MRERKLESDRYRCSLCGEEFLTTRSDEEAVAESNELFGSDHQDWVILCDECFKKVEKSRRG